ncbi:threonylcarbamoyl-AMP synthase [Candidatus Woesearchaeota archaeon]|nr:threonylcarbamoyl-AMP synthase [Candidatus Woesearchaeota archaeon]
MEVLTKAELQVRFDEIAEKIRKGAVFIHPTDTIYGLSCNAVDEKAVAKIRTLKQRQDNPLSVWAPNIDWIKKNCAIDKKSEEWLNKLPGPYTLILKLRNKSVVAKSVNLGQETLGVRIPEHWFGKVVEKLNLPLVTTSANQQGKPFMTKLENLDPELEVGVEFIIYEGEKSGHPSKLIDLVKGTVKER